MTDNVFINGIRHQIVTLDTFDRLVWPNCIVELPQGRGWATSEVDGTDYATWLEWDQVAAR